MRWLPSSILLLALLAPACSSEDLQPSVEAAAESLTPTTTGPADAAPSTPPTTAVATTAATTTTTEAQKIDAVIGAETLNDPYYPDTGNGGYDVSHYDLALRVDIAAVDRIEGVATIDFIALDRLERLSLDLVGLDVTAATMGGAPVAFAQTASKLRITPNAPLDPETEHTLIIDYGGEPRSISTGNRIDPIGWLDLPTVSVVASEPVGARTWFPVNDHPSDKATYSVALDVATPLIGVSNGELVEQRIDDERTTSRWTMDQPMASYLATVAIGEFELVDSAPGGDVAVLDAVATVELDSFDADFDRTDEMLVVFSELFGPYPFDGYGAIVADAGFGFALETQGRSLFGGGMVDGSGSIERIVAHELAHQWFGNHVTPTAWRDIWLNEGLASYAEDLWVEFGRGGDPGELEARLLLRAGNALTPAPGDPGPADLFALSVYRRGAATVHALRVEVGDDIFFEILREWVTRFGGGNASTAEFIELAEELAAAELDPFFADWLGDGPLPELGVETR